MAKRKSDWFDTKKAIQSVESDWGFGALYPSSVKVMTVENSDSKALADKLAKRVNAICDTFEPPELGWIVEDNPFAGLDRSVGEPEWYSVRTADERSLAEKCIKQMRDTFSPSQRRHYMAIREIVFYFKGNPFTDPSSRLPATSDLPRMDEALNWLTHADRAGRTFLLMVAFLDKAVQNPTEAVCIYDHYNPRGRHVDNRIMSNSILHHIRRFPFLQRRIIVESDYIHFQSYAGEALSFMDTPW